LQNVRGARVSRTQTSRVVVTVFESWSVPYLPAWSVAWYVTRHLPSTRVSIATCACAACVNVLPPSLPGGEIVTRIS
jgi:hypothetical protein